MEGDLEDIRFITTPDLDLPIDLDPDLDPDEWDVPTTMWSRPPARPALEADPRACTLPDITVPPPISEPSSVHAITARAEAPVAEAPVAFAQSPEPTRRDWAKDKIVPIAFVVGVTIVFAVLLAVTPGVRTAGHGKAVAEVNETKVADGETAGRRTERREAATVASTPLVAVVTEAKPVVTAKPKPRITARPQNGPRERSVAEDVQDAQSALAQAQLEQALR